VRPLPHAGPRAVYQTAEPPPPRTLLDVFLATTQAHPEAPALDDGSTVLTYRDAWGRITALRDDLVRAGVRVGDRVGVRMPSGDVELYLAILAVLALGAAYVPVEHDDPEERALSVWREARVRGVLGPGARFTPHAGAAAGPPTGRPGPTPADDAWVIFTSGSTGLPKGVAISHRSAAAFVDAEATLFLRERPLGPGDRVLAGLSVAFDASCEEMWLAWRHGGCLVPSPRALVQAGVELGPWLVERGITVVSTVPTLVALWPAAALERVRLLILGGEACPEELARRLRAPGREVWNTYGPTETTVVASAARLDQEGPVRIGLPLRGWWLAVLDPAGVPVAPGQDGELVIAGVGTGRYLDPDKDREKYRPVPALGWHRAYHSGDLVRADPRGLIFLGRADDQVKLGGRRIELGEIDTALLALPDVVAAAAAVRTTAGGGEVLVGYLVPAPGSAGPDSRVARATLRTVLPAGLVPQLVTVDALPLKTSGKVDRAALPWPGPGQSGPGQPDGEGAGPGAAVDADGTLGWLAGMWHELLGVPVERDADFFDLGGTSLATARLVTRLRERYPEVSVADVYQTPRLTELAARLDELDGDRAAGRLMHRTPVVSGMIQALVITAFFGLRGLQWLLGLAILRTLLQLVSGVALAGPSAPWGYLVAGWLVLASPPGRLLVVGLGVRAIRRGLRPGCYPRGGSEHLRLWAAGRLAATFGMGSLAGTPLAPWYARLLGCRVGRDVDLRSDPPVTGLAEFGDGCAVESEADLAGWWLDGDMLQVGMIRVGAGARIGGRATLMPGTSVGVRAEIEPGASVHGDVPSGERWDGVPARRVGLAGADWPADARRRSAAWGLIYIVSVFAVGVLPVVAAIPGLALWGFRVSADRRLHLAHAFVVSPLAGVVSVLFYALLTAGVIRLAGRALRPGLHPTGSRAGWAAWLIERLSASSRDLLFPLYASIATPAWFRLLGATVGRRAEISTTSGLPSLMRVEDGAFLADDTLVAPYELRGGWVRLGPSRVGRRGFAGNSAIVGPDRAVADGGLVAVLGTTPPDMPDGTSWVGRPAFELPRVADAADPARTFEPPSRLVLARAGIELLRVLPWAVSAVLGTLLLFLLDQVQLAAGWLVCAAVAGPVLVGCGCVALMITTAVKWLLVGRFTPSEHPLWSPFVWRNELFDTFYEELGMPWLGSALLGTPMMNAWLRTLGARIGRGVWCESHWLPEPDLIHLGDAATVNRGCVLQTHLFHDRIMRLDSVRLGAGATLGPHGILLPGSTVGAGALIGASSLVMRGETVPAESRWLGNPIAAHPDRMAASDRPTGRGRHSAADPARPIPTSTSRGGVALAAVLAALALTGVAGPLAWTRPLSTALPAAGSMTPPHAVPGGTGPGSPHAPAGRPRRNQASGRHQPGRAGHLSSTLHASPPVPRGLATVPWGHSAVGSRAGHAPASSTAPTPE
jgi:non-ribosomal peptide synthetase-like protein